MDDERISGAAHHSPRWQLDELGHAGPEHLDGDYVAAYDEKSPTDWSEDVAALLASRRRLDEHRGRSRSAGTGAFALAISPHVARVVAVDVSEHMVAAMHARGIEAVRAGSSTTSTRGTHPTRSSRGTRSTTFRTSGKRSRLSAWRALSSPVAY